MAHASRICLLGSHPTHMASEKIERAPKIQEAPNFAPRESVTPVESTACDPPPGALEHFAATITQWKPPDMHIPAWWISRAWHRFGNRCAYCGDHPHTTRSRGVDHVLPVELGGPHHVDAVVPCCWRCRQRKGHRDALLSHPNLPEPIRKLRETLVPRSAGPRFLCFVWPNDGGGFIGWRNTWSVPIELPWMLREEFHGQRQANIPHAPGVPIVLWISPAIRFAEAIAAVRNHNGVLQFVSP
jgi:5-methylcytosine-specific restriction endonuclease McrA